jgi:hypothetical protein
MRFIIYTFVKLWARIVWTSAVINCSDITWSFSLLKKLSYISVQFSLRTLTHHNNFTQTFIFCKIKFFTSSIAAEYCSSESRKIVSLSSNLMRWRSRQIEWDETSSDLMRWRFRQIWWNDAFVRFDEMTLSLNLMRWRSFVKFDESSSSNLMSRFCQVWWVAFVKFDESSHQTSLERSRTRIRHSIIENEHA